MRPLVLTVSAMRKTAEAWLATSDRGKGIINLDPCPRDRFLSTRPPFVVIAYPLFTFSKAWLRAFTSDSEASVWGRDNNNQIFWRYSPGELIALCLPHLEQEGFCFRKHWAMSMEQNLVGSPLWFVLFSLWSKEKAVGYMSSTKESRREVQSCSHRAARVLPTPYTTPGLMACCLLFTWPFLQGLEGRTRTQLPQVES